MDMNMNIYDAIDAMRPSSLQIIVCMSSTPFIIKVTRSRHSSANPSPFYLHQFDFRLRLHFD